MEARIRELEKAVPREVIVMDMVIFRTIFFELLVFFTFTLLILHSIY